MAHLLYLVLYFHDWRYGAVCCPGTQLGLSASFLRVPLCGLLRVPACSSSGHHACFLRSILSAECRYVDLLMSSLRSAAASHLLHYISQNKSQGQPRFILFYQYLLLVYDYLHFTPVQNTFIHFQDPSKCHSTKAAGWGLIS